MKKCALQISVAYKALIGFIGIFFYFNNYAEMIRPGDLIFLELNCKLCQLIAKNEQTPYSHAGLVIESKKSTSKLSVLEAWGKVRETPLEEFIQKKSGKWAIYRIKEWQVLDQKKYREILDNIRWRYDYFFADLNYDTDFLWNNSDLEGKELLYCTELITKLVNPNLFYPIPIQPMNFTEYYDEWLDLLNKAPPQGELGNSPGSLTRWDGLNLIAVF